MEITSLHRMENPASKQKGPGSAAHPVAQVYNEFRLSLLRYIRSKIRSREDGEDILHNVFVRISENAESLARKDNLRNWLFIVTRNAIIDYYRKNAGKRHIDLNETVSDVLVVEEARNETGGLDRCLAGFIDLLPETYRPILIDSELREVRQKDLADKYRIPYSSLRSRVQRGREKVKQQLLECCRIENDRWGNILEANPRNACAEEMCKKCEV